MIEEITLTVLIFIQKDLTGGKENQSFFESESIQNYLTIWVSS